MSLSNPNAVVTEERLNEYHQTILPYLGGMPDVLANKFSRADLYSTDEKMIGRWVDGKPLYQKTIHPSLANNSYIDISSLGCEYLDVFNVKYKQKSNGSGSIPFLGSNFCSFISEYSNGSITKIITLNSNSYITDANYDAYVTLQYTKTTDSPVAIGDDTDYSTDEKIVGTWIDGKPLYQRTFVKSSDFSADFYLADLSDSNIDTIIKGEGWWTRLGGGVVTQYPFGRTETPTYPNYDVNIRYAGDVKKLRVLITSYPTNEITNMRYTIQYTKTS